MAELAYGIAVAADPLVATRRAARYARAREWFEPLPFGVGEAEKYGELAALVVKAGRSPRPRRLDLMIAAVAAANHLPLYTLNPADFVGLAPVLTLA
jgi:predicted nucleic acid-binding protein